MGTDRECGGSGRGGGQAACQVVMDASWAGASLMLTRARKQMVFQPERNFQGVTLPHLLRPLHVGPAGLSFLFKVRATGIGKGMGLGWGLGRANGGWGRSSAAWALGSSGGHLDLPPAPVLLPPLHLWPPSAVFSAPLLCPAFAQPCHFQPGPNPSLSWLSSKPASRVSFLSH